MYILFAAESVLNDGRLTYFGKVCESAVQKKNKSFQSAEGKGKSFLSLKISN